MQASKANSSNMAEGDGAMCERHPRHQDAVLGMDVREGDLFGEAREDAEDREEEVPGPVFQIVFQHPVAGLDAKRFSQEFP